MFPNKNGDFFDSIGHKRTFRSAIDHVRSTPDCVAKLDGRLGSRRVVVFCDAPGRPLVLRGALPRIGSTTGRLRETNSTPQRRWTTDELGKAPQVLRGSGEQDLVPRAAQTAQSKSIEPEDALHMGKPHLDLLALPT